jgi:hypothetical protein
MAHHDHAVGDLADQAEVVGDEQHRHLVLLLQPRDQVHDLLLDRHVQRRGRLVGDQERGSQAIAIAIITRCCWPPDIWLG